MSDKNSPSTEPDWQFAHLRLGAMAVIAIFVIYIAVAHLLPGECCQTPKIAKSIAIGLPMAFFCMFVSHAHVLSAKHFRAKARKMALWAARIAMYGALAFLCTVTSSFLRALNSSADNYFTVSLVAAAVLLSLHSFYLNRSKLALPSESEELGKGKP